MHGCVGERRAGDTDPVLGTLLVQYRQSYDNNKLILVVNARVQIKDCHR